MLIYTEHLTERLLFALEHVFTRNSVAFRCTGDKEEFLKCAAPKINYSTWDCGTENRLSPATLLFDGSIRPLGIEKSSWRGHSVLAFEGIADPLASIFYCLSRYEEYLPGKRDSHGRFEATSSILFQFGWLKQQMVEQWTEQILLAFCPVILPDLRSRRNVTVIPSFDIDNTFAYKAKTGRRKLLATARDLFNRNFDRLKERRRVLKNEINDPYDTFAAIEQIAADFPETRIFWHLGDQGKFDRNISWRNSQHRQMILQMAGIATIGLHPSYASNSSERLLRAEKKRIDTILKISVEESRQHFLKLNLPETYRRLVRLGFRRDFTMGYSDHPGFRAGTAHSFFFFDLGRNLRTDYEIVPFVYMDGTFHDYMKVSPEEAIKVIDELAEEVGKYGGNFCFIWHNETIGNAFSWKGWSQVLDHTVKIFGNGLDKN
jgi:hypothetical protein